jgi:hypothetical protein
VRKSDGNRQQRQQHSAQRAIAIANNKTEGNRQRQQHSAQRATAIAINKSVGNRQQRQQHTAQSASAIANGSSTVRSPTKTAAHCAKRVSNRQR